MDRGLGQTRRNEPGKTDTFRSARWEVLMTEYPMPASWVLAKLCKGLVIPAHPLALTDKRRFDPRRQQALTRYYHAAGAGGIAVGVHTTQFEIREPQHGLLQP